MDAVAYSYMRFSTLDQKKGDSIRRQTVLRDTFLERNKLKLDTSLTFIDAGVSGHKGKHRSSDKFALGYFLSLVKSGRIAPGSYLIVESLDRLSREDTDEALELLLSLTRSGIRVVQLQPAEIIYQKPVEPMKLMMGIMELSRGHSESRMKSERIAAAWEQKRHAARASKTAISKQCPSWLIRNGDKYDIIPDRAETVRLIFKYCADGFGINGIIRRLIDEGRKPFGRTQRWGSSYLGAILARRTVLGEYQPMKDKRPCGEPIIGFYPAVVSEALYYKAQAGLKERLNHSGGKSRHDVNLFQGLMRNAVDGDRFEYRWFTDYKRGKKYGLAKYVNSLALVSQATLSSFPVAPLEKGILACLAEINPLDILPEQDNTENISALTAQFTETDAQLQKIEDELVRGDDLGVLVNAAKRLVLKKKEIGDRLAAARIKASSPQGEAWGTCHTLISVLETSKDKESARLRLRSTIRRIIDHMECLFVRINRRQIACMQFHFNDSDVIRTVFVRHRGELTSNNRKIPPHLSYSTMTDGLPDKVDIRDPKQRRLVLAVLQKLCEEKSWQKAFEPDRPTSAERIATRRCNYMKNYVRRSRQKPN